MRAERSHRVRWQGALAAVLTFASSGCFATSSEHDVLQRRVVAMDTRLHAIEAADHDRQAQLTRADQQVRMLNEQLEQARTQTRNLADLGARLDGIDEQIRQLHGSTDEVRRTVETNGTDESTQRQELANRLSAIERRVHEARVQMRLDQPDPQEIPSTPADIMTQARSAMTAQQYDRVRLLAGTLLQRTPQDPLADDAQLLVAQSYGAQNRNATAVQEFQRLLATYPSADTVPQALSDMAEALVRLGLCVPAQRTLRLLIDRSASSPQGQAARRRIEEVRRMPRTVCQG